MKQVRDPHFRIVFSNAMRLRLGDNDGGITFVLQTDDETGQEYQSDQVQVVMTPRSMKILHMTLTHALNEMERVLGPISLTPEKQAEIEKMLNSVTVKKATP